MPLAALVDSPTPAPAVNGSDPGDAAAAPGNTTAALPTLPPTAPTAVEEVDSPAPPVRPTIVSVGPEVVKAGEALMVVGSGFGEAVSDVRVMVGGRNCRDPELCHLVCRPCGDEDRCEFDEMCMEDGLSKEKVGPMCMCMCVCVFLFFLSLASIVLTNEKTPVSSRLKTQQDHDLGPREGVRVCVCTLLTKKR